MYSYSSVDEMQRWVLDRYPGRVHWQVTAFQLHFSLAEGGKCLVSEVCMKYLELGNCLQVWIYQGPRDRLALGNEVASLGSVPGSWVCKAVWYLSVVVRTRADSWVLKTKAGDSVAVSGGGL